MLHVILNANANGRADLTPVELGRRLWLVDESHSVPRARELGRIQLLHDNAALPQLLPTLLCGESADIDTHGVEDAIKARLADLVHVGSVLAAVRAIHLMKQGQ